jgi:hypothetical protein
MVAVLAEWGVPVTASDIISDTDFLESRASGAEAILTRKYGCA